MPGLSPLPIDSTLAEIVGLLRHHRAVVVQAPTGSGKTTRIPRAILKAGMGKMLMLQPRRVAARSCAARIAAELGEPLGQTVGYHIRFEKRFSRQTRLLVVTEGLLTRRFQSDPTLEDLGCVILDEFHERSVHADLALAFLSELMALRDDLKVVVMSATLDGGPVSKFLGDCPVVRSEGRTFPLDIRYQAASPVTPDGEHIARALEALFADPRDDGGDILVFLAGAPEIRQAGQFLAQKSWQADILPFHGGLSSREQDMVLAQGERRRIILATNIAETSLTIPGVTAVIDTGRRKMMHHHPGKGLDILEKVRISKASADQRAGRAGRTSPGRVIRLWDEALHAAMAPQDPPEIQVTDLCGPLLNILDFHGPELSDFPFFERPPQRAIDHALETLTMLGAREATGRLTEKGRKMAAIPLHPRLSCILERTSRLALVHAGARLCALLAESLPPMTSLDFLELCGSARTGSGLDPRIARRVRDTGQQLKKLAANIWPADVGGDSFSGIKQLAKVLLSGFPDRLCKVTGKGRALTISRRGVRLKEDQDASFVVALDLMESGQGGTAGKAGIAVPLGLEDIAAELPLRVEHKLVFDEERAAVRGVKQTRFGEFVLEERPSSIRDPDQAALLLSQPASQRFGEFFQPDKETRQLIHRLNFAARHLPDLTWPDVTETGLKELLPQVLAGSSRLADLKKVDWRGAVLARLDWRSRQVLDKEVPERWTVPSGSKVVIDYQPAFSATGFPVLAVRLQEMFGLTETPRIARGTVPLLLHLLAPNMRPCQVTQDLQNFWNTTYAQVRKELRQRYPKHHWPEDPWTAEPVRGTRGRKH